MSQQRKDVDLNIVGNIKKLIQFNKEEQAEFQNWYESNSANPGRPGEQVTSSDVSGDMFMQSFDSDMDLGEAQNGDWLPLAKIEEEEKKAEAEEPMIKLWRKNKQQELQISHGNLNKLIKKHNEKQRLRQEIQANNEIDPYAIRIYTPEHQQKRDSLKNEEMLLNEFLEQEYMPKVEKLKDFLEKRVQKPQKMLRQISRLIQANSNLEQQSMHKANFDAIQGFIESIKKQSRFFETAKHGNAPLLNLAEGKDPTSAFIKNCNKEKVLVTAIGTKINNQTLELVDYRVNKGIANGLRTLLMSDSSLITRCVLDNNGLADDLLALLLEGLVNQKHYKSLIIRNNTFGELSLAKLGPSLERRMPINVTELRLINCKISAASTEQLLRLLENTQLCRFSLVNANLTSENFQRLLTIIETSNTLTELDISWNCLRHKSFVGLFELLKSNTRLQSLNISWNSLQEAKNPKSEELTPGEKEMVLNFHRFITHNMNLLQLDISHCKVNASMLFAIMESLARAPSLLTVDISGNQGISAKMKRAICRRLKAKSTKLDIKSFCQVHNLAKAMQKEIEQEQPRHLQYLESIHLKKMKQTLMQTHYLKARQAADSHKLIYQRILGHVQDLPGLRNWTEISDVTRPLDIVEDFVTERYKYTLVFWSKSMASSRQIRAQSDQERLRELDSCLETPSETALQ